MCFHLHRDHLKPYIAKAIIKTYKVLYRKNENGYKAYHRKFYYTPGKLYTRDKKLRPVKGVWGDKIINGGFHSYSSRSRAIHHRQGSRVIIKQFIIPKGATYYYNPSDKEYVSDKLRMVKPVKS